MTDQQIKNRPKCQKCGLENSGIVFYGDLIVCGNCAIKIHNKMNQWIKEI